jgi:hypothetical protein
LNTKKVGGLYAADLFRQLPAEGRFRYFALHGRTEHLVRADQRASMK